jgi:Ca2+-binding RTX toxin-like protein
MYSITIGTVQSVSMSLVNAAIDVLEAAMDIFSQHLSFHPGASVDIVVDFIDLDGNTLATASPDLTFIRREGGFDIYEVSTLIELRTGSDPNGFQSDVDITIDSGTLSGGEFYLGLDANVPDFQIDLLTVLLHELGHGFGIIAFAGDVPGAKTTLELFVTGATNNKVFNGPAAVAAFGSPVPMDNDPSHVRQTLGDLMSPAIPSGVRRPISAIDLGILRDIGAPMSAPTEAADRIYGTAAANVVFLLGGDDWYSGQGGNDEVHGQNGADTLFGDDGDDLLVGGPGADSLNGGEGVDTADYSASSVGVYVPLGSGQPRNGDAQGDTLISIENLTGSSHNDTLLGSGGANRLKGGLGADSLWGAPGDDVLEGEDGNDFLHGGQGNDQLFGGNGDDILVGLSGADVLDGGAGTDTADYSASSVGVYAPLGSGQPRNGDAQGDTLISIENLTGSAHSDTLLGNGGANRLKGGAGADSLWGGPGNDVLEGEDGNDFLHGGQGNDQLFGGNGDDSLVGLSGADVLDGGAGVDTADYSASPVGVYVPLGSGQPRNGDAQGDTLVSIENLTGSAHSDTLLGNGGANRLKGGLGADSLWGGPGDDLLEGEDGNDFLHGGQGNDQLLGGNGDDILVGLSGADVLDGGVGIDTASYSTSSVGVSVDLAANIALNGDAEGDTFAGIENLLGSTFDDGLFGDDGANDIRGGDGNDTIDGAGGDDTLYGDGGADTLSGGDGDDALFGGDGDDLLDSGPGADVMDGGSGIDTASYATSVTGVSVDLAANIGLNGDAEGDTFAGIENLLGSVFDDNLFGDDGANDLRGDDGNDDIRGTDGEDALFGGEGDDSLNGGAGADMLSGDAGNDTFVFELGGGADTILDFAAGEASEDVIELVGFGEAFDEFAEVLGAATEVGSDTVIDFGGGDTLILKNVSIASLHVDDFLFA